jgi:hypothetical protein
VFWTRPAAIVASIARVTSKGLVGRRIPQIGIRAGIAFVMSATRDTSGTGRWWIIGRIIGWVFVWGIVGLTSVIVCGWGWERVGGGIVVLALRSGRVGSIGTHWWRRVWSVVCIHVFLFFATCDKLLVAWCMRLRYSELTSAVTIAITVSVSV